MPVEMKRVLDPLELELQVVVNWPARVPGIQLGSSARAAFALNCSDIPSAPDMVYISNVARIGIQITSHSQRYQTLSCPLNKTSTSCYARVTDPRKSLYSVYRALYDNTHSRSHLFEFLHLGNRLSLCGPLQHRLLATHGDQLLAPQ